MFVFAWLAFFVFSSPTTVHAQAIRGDLRTVTGLKYPADATEGRDPVAVSVTAAGPDYSYGGFAELVPFALRAPNQEEAGSCLYMSLTGIAEWWLARLHPNFSRDPNGPLDLSERHFMNTAGLQESGNGVRNWKTDSIYIFNRMPGVLTNAQYPFAKGWHKMQRGNYVKASPQEPGAVYDASYNWINELDQVSDQPLTKLPTFQREVLFADPSSNQWNTGIMPKEMVARIKNALRTRRAPVHVIYNHFGYWHATMIVGYDDEADNGQCAFVNKFLTYMKTHSEELTKKAELATNPREKERLLQQAQRANEAYRKTRNAYDQGGCEGKGVFYVRDSIYPDPEGPVYDYDPANQGEEGPYSKRIVLLEYEWIRYMANHVTQIYLQ